MTQQRAIKTRAVLLAGAAQEFARYGYAAALVNNILADTPACTPPRKRQRARHRVAASAAGKPIDGHCPRSGYYRDSSVDQTDRDLALQASPNADGPRTCGVRSHPFVWHNRECRRFSRNRQAESLRRTPRVEARRIRRSTDIARTGASVDVDDCR